MFVVNTATSFVTMPCSLWKTKDTRQLTRLVNLRSTIMCCERRKRGTTCKRQRWLPASSEGMWPCRVASGRQDLQISRFPTNVFPRLARPALSGPAGVCRCRCQQRVLPLFKLFLKPCPESGRRCHSCRRQFTEHQWKRRYEYSHEYSHSWLRIMWAFNSRRVSGMSPLPAEKNLLLLRSRNEAGNASLSRVRHFSRHPFAEEAEPEQYPRDRHCRAECRPQFRWLAGRTDLSN